LLQVAPGIKAGIAGRDGERFTHYRNAGTDIYGWQPDIRPFYAASRIMVAPLFTGAGLQNKLLEAMSMGIPCITTSVANASLRAIPGEQVLVADHAEDFVKQIRLLLHDETLHQKLAIQGKAFVLKQYTWEAANQQLAALLFPSC